MKSFYETYNLLSQPNMDGLILSMYQNNFKIKEIKQATNASTGRIYRTLDDFGIKNNRLRKDHDLVRFYHNSWGMPIEEISKYTNYSTRWIREVLKKG